MTQPLRESSGGRQRALKEPLRRLGGQRSLGPGVVGGDSGDSPGGNGVRACMSGESLASPPSRLRSGQGRTSRAVGGNPGLVGRSAPDTSGRQVQDLSDAERRCRGTLGGFGNPRRGILGGFGAGASGDFGGFG